MESFKCEKSPLDTNLVNIQLSFKLDKREKPHINEGKIEIIEAFVKSHLSGGIKEIAGEDMDILIAFLEERFCFEHNKAGIPTPIKDTTLTKYVKEAEKRLSQEKDAKS